MLEKVTMAAMMKKTIKAELKRAMKINRRLAQLSQQVESQTIA
jgi:hypothetical protein